MAGFIPKFYHDGAVDSWVHFPAAVGEYHIGMALIQTSGNLNKATGTVKPTYICMAEGKIENAGDVIAAIPVDESTEFEVTLAGGENITPGENAAITLDGMGIEGNPDGHFRVVSASGVNEGDTAVGRFA